MYFLGMRAAQKIAARAAPPTRRVFEVRRVKYLSSTICIEVFRIGRAQYTRYNHLLSENHWHEDSSSRFY